MVDSDEEENADYFPGNFIELEKIQCSPSHSTDPIVPNGCSLVVIKDHAFNQDDDPIVFPPINHENLHLSIPKILHHHQQHNTQSFPFPSYSHEDATSPSSSSSSSSSSDCFSPSDDNSLPNTPVRSESLSADVAKCCWWKLGLEALYGKVNGVVVYLRSFRFARGVFLTFQSPAALAAMLLAFLYFGWRRRRRQQPRAIVAEGRNEHLLRAIKEKDERINQLLNQIARLNEVLLAMHRVPSSKTG